MKKGYVFGIVLLAGLLHTGAAFSRDVMLPLTWESVVHTHDFIGVVEAERDSYLKVNRDKRWGRGVVYVFMRCTVRDSIKGPANGSSMEILLGMAIDPFGDQAPRAAKGEQFFLAVSRGSFPGQRPPLPRNADYWLGGGRPIGRLPLSNMQTERLLFRLGKGHSTLEEFAADARGLLSLSDVDYETEILRANLRAQVQRLKGLNRNSAPIEDIPSETLPLNELLVAVLDIGEKRPRLLDPMSGKSILWLGPVTFDLLKGMEDRYDLLSEEYLKEYRQYLDWKEEIAAYGQQLKRSKR